MELIQAMAVKNKCYIEGNKLIPAGIVVHSTAADNATLKRYCDNERELGKNGYNNHWNQYTPDGRLICMHGFVGLDVNNEIAVAQSLPFDMACWGCGVGSKGSYNSSHIQFEICEDKTNIEYTKLAFNKAVEFCVYLCKKYDIPVSKVVSHKEAHSLGYASNHGDPEHWMKMIGWDMDVFRGKVSEGLEGTSDKDVKDGLYQVQVGVYSEKENAEAMLKKVIKAGFKDAFIKNCAHDEKEVVLKSLDEVAKEVILGLWGNGDERVKRLTEAGYNFSEVQNKVNKLL